MVVQGPAGPDIRVVLAVREVAAYQATSTRPGGQWDNRSTRARWDVVCPLVERTCARLREDSSCESVGYAYEGSNPSVAMPAELAPSPALAREGLILSGPAVSGSVRLSAGHTWDTLVP